MKTEPTDITAIVYRDNRNLILSFTDENDEPTDKVNTTLSKLAIHIHHYVMEHSDIKNMFSQNLMVKAECLPDSEYLIEIDAGNNSPEDIGLDNKEFLAGLCSSIGISHFQDSKFDQEGFLIPIRRASTFCLEFANHTLS